MQYEIVAILIFLAFSAFFSGSETALFSLSHVRVRKLQAEKKRRPALVAELLSHPRRLLVTILIGNMLVNIFASSLSASFFRTLFADSHVFKGMSDLVSVFVMTTLILIFGEITPKTYAIQHPEKLALRVAPLIHAFSVIVRPIRAALKGVADAIVGILTRTVKPEEVKASEGELRTAVKMGVSQGLLDHQEQAMIHGLFEIETSQVREMMKPRSEIFALDLSTPVDEICRVFQEKRYTRVPMHTGDIDDVLGLLYAKDLLFASKSDLEKSGVRGLLRPVYFVPETMPVDRLLREFRARATHFALVVDEYGSISGLITMEDVLQSLMGQLGPARTASADHFFLDPDTAILRARLALSDFNELFSSSLSDELSVTIGGYLTHHMGKIPPAGEVYETEQFRFEIRKATRNKIEEILVKRKKPSASE
jgi:putative hemolysin